MDCTLFFYFTKNFELYLNFTPTKYKVVIVYFQKRYN